jgi:hypothetical protein
MNNCIIFFLLLTLLNSAASGQETNSIAIKVARNKTMVAVKIGNLLIPDIILDTGFAYDGVMIYNPAYIDSLDLSRAIEVQLGGAGSGEDSKALMIDSADFNVGGFKMMNQRIIILQNNIYKGFPSNGIIGYSIFGHYATEFDYDKNTMILHKTNDIKVDSGWTEIPLFFKSNNIPWLMIPVVIEEGNPISLATYIDFAAADPILLLEKPGMKFSLPHDISNQYLGRGLSGDIYGKTGTIKKLCIGPFELYNVKVSFAPAAVRSKQDGAEAILGNGALRRFNLIFDYSNKKLYLKRNSHFADPYQ